MTEQTTSDAKKDKDKEENSSAPTSAPSGASKKKAGQKITKKERSGSTSEAKSNIDKVSGDCHYYCTVVVRILRMYPFGGGSIVPTSARTYRYCCCSTRTWYCSW